MWCVRVAVVNGGTLSFPAAGLFHTIVVLKLTAIVHRDALKHGVEVLAQAALQTIERPDHAGGGMVRHREDDARPGEPFREHHQRPAGAHGAHHAVHLPVAKSSAGVDDGVTLINAGAFGGSGSVPLFTVFLTIVAAALFVQVLRVEDQEHITPVDVIVERGLTDRGVKLGAALP